MSTVLAKQDLKELANYLKTQEQEKSSHEMNIDELKQSTNFYRTQIKVSKICQNYYISHNNKVPR